MPAPPFAIEIDHLPVAVLFAETAAPEAGAISAANGAACLLFGRSRDHLVGAAVATVLQLTQPAWQGMVDEVTQAGTAERWVDLVRPSGELALQLLLSRASHAGETLIQIVLLDHTVRRPGRAPADDAAGRASSEPPAPRIDSLGLVAGGIAHDFNNLLVGVLAEASAAREDRSLGAGPREALRRIEAAAQRMSRLTKQLLAYAGRGRFVPVRLDPDAMLGELREQLGRMVAAPAVLEVTVGTGNIVVEADPGLLRQVVLNLVANAGEAGGQRVQVASRILSRDNAPWWQLEVSDDGAGIDPTTLAQIFDPFFSTKPDRHGLGLSAVQGIVRRLGGDIEVDSQPGQGARFRVRLPIVPGAGVAAPRPKQETSAPTPRLAGLRLLVADDEPSVRSTVRRLLERRGATVVAVADGMEAEARLRDERFDLIVLDVTMPGRNGYDVLVFARQTQPGVPVILMSGYTAQVRGAGAEDEPDAFIEKPFTAKALDAAIDAALGPVDPPPEP